QHVSVVAGSECRAHTDRYATDLQDAKERRDPLREIQRDESHTVADPHAKFFEGITDLIDFLRDLPKGHLAFRAIERDLIGPFREVMFQNVDTVVVVWKVRDFLNDGSATHGLFSREGNTAGRLFRIPSRPASRSGLKNPIISRTMA